jgi:hypothetical protein
MVVRVLFAIGMILVLMGAALVLIIPEPAPTVTQVQEGVHDEDLAMPTLTPAPTPTPTATMTHTPMPTPTATLTLIPTVTPKQPYICTVAQALNLRSGPSAIFDIVVALPIGTMIQPLGYSPTGLSGTPWILVHVQGRNQRGWISVGSEYLTCNFNLTELPLAALPPSPPTLVVTLSPSSTPLATPTATRKPQSRPTRSPVATAQSPQTAAAVQTAAAQTAQAAEAQTAQVRANQTIQAGLIRTATVLLATQTAQALAIDQALADTQAAQMAQRSTDVAALEMVRHATAVAATQTVVAAAVSMQPTDQFTTTPTSTPAPTAIIVAEHPSRMNMGTSDTISLSLSRMIALVGSPIVVRPARTSVVEAPALVGTPEADLARAFGTSYDAVVIAKLIAPAFDVQPTGDEQSLDQQQSTWRWGITPKSSGRQIVIINIAGEWRPKEGGTPIRRQLWMRELVIDIREPLFTRGQINVASLLCTFLGTGLSIPLIIGHVRTWLRRRKENSKTLTRRRTPKGKK